MLRGTEILLDQLLMAVVALSRRAIELSIQSEISANQDAVFIGHAVTAQNRRDT